MNSGSDVESSAFDDLSSGARLSEHRDSLSDDMILGTEASILGHDGAYGSSSDELDLVGAEVDAADAAAAPPHYARRSRGRSNGAAASAARPEHARKPGRMGSLPPSASACSLSSRVCATGTAPDDRMDADRFQGFLKAASASSSTGTATGTGSDACPTIYVQLHGEAVRRLGPDERPLQIQTDFLFKLGFKDPWRVQEEGMNTEIGSLLRFYAGKALFIGVCGGCF